MKSFASILVALAISQTVHSATLEHDGYVVTVTPALFPRLVRLNDPVTISVEITRPDGEPFFSHWFTDSGVTSHAGVTSGPNGFVILPDQNTATLVLDSVTENEVADYYLFVADEDFSSPVQFEEDGTPYYFSPTGGITVTTANHFDALSTSLQNYFIATGQAAAAGVPEPTTATLLLVSCLYFGGRRQRTE
jgi:hypothetical protein